MAKVSYANLKLKMKSDIKTFDFEGQTIEVKQYLPIEDKYDLIMITLQEALEDSIFNPLKVDLFFHLNIVYLYTNLSFTDKQRENEEKIYDALTSNGFIDKVIENIPSEEYDILFEYIENIKEDTLKYKTSAGALLQGVIQDLPKQMEAAKKIIDTFDENKYAEVQRFAAAANGNRPIAIDKIDKK